MKLIQVNPDLTITKPITIMKQSPWAQKDNRYRSFCIWRESPSRWHLWGGGGASTEPYNTYYFFSVDGLYWAEPQLVHNEDGKDPFQDLRFSNWHMSGKPNRNEGRVEFLVYSTVYFPIHWSRFLKNPILYAECSIDEPTVFRTPIDAPILLPSSDGWDNGNLYRCTFQIIDNGDKYRYSIWYSAESFEGQWHLGHTEGFIATSHR